MLRCLILFIILLYGITASSQQYNYLQFTVADGLPSNTIYDIKQDKDGFMWVATDAGLARFDGRKFHTFTVEDGLPSNDVIYLMPDSKGRVWVLTLANTICFYSQGKFHTSQNDSTLKQIRFSSTVFFITENDRGDIAFACAADLCPNFYVLTTENKVIEDKLPAALVDKSSISAGGKFGTIEAGKFDVIDLEDNGIATGTQVIVKFPDVFQW